MKIKEITYAIKRGLPNYSSVNAGITIEISGDEDVEEVFARAREICEQEAVVRGEKVLDEAERLAKGEARNKAIKRNIENKK